MARKKDPTYEEYENELNRQIRDQKFFPCTLICGNEDYLRSLNTKKLCAAILGDGDAMNRNIFHGNDIDVNEVLSLAQTLPFFSERRVIVLEDTGFFAGGKKKRQADTNEEDNGSTAAQQLAAAMSDIPDTTFFIFEEETVNGNLKLTRAVKKYGWIMKCDTPDPAYLRKFIVNTMRSCGMSIEPEAVSLLLSYTGEDMLNIRNECCKLADYCLGRKSAGKEDVEAICCIRLKDRIFDMITAIANGSRPAALDIYMDLLQLQTAPQIILALMLRQFNQLLQAGELRAEGKDSSEIAAALHLQPWILENKILPLVRGKSAFRLQQALESCVQANMDYRSGKIDARLATEELIIRWSAPGALEAKSAGR